MEFMCINLIGICNISWLIDVIICNQTVLMFHMTGITDLLFFFVLNLLNESDSFRFRENEMTMLLYLDVFLFYEGNFV